MNTGELERGKSRITWKGFVSALLKPDYSAGYLFCREKSRIAKCTGKRRKLGFSMINVVAFAVMTAI